MTGANYTTVKQILCETFGRTEAIISSLYGRLEDISRAGDSFSDIRHVQSDMEAILCQLETQGEQLNEQRLLCQKLWSKLPITVATKLEESRGLADAGTQWKLNDFRIALKRYVIMQETVLRRTNTGGTTAEDATRYSAGALVTGARKFMSRNKSDGDWNASSMRGCAFCGGSHLDKSCTKYGTVAQRKDELIEQKHCFVCLRTGHRSTQCKATRKCNVCSRMGHHHVTICPESQQKSGNSTNLVADQPVADEVPASSTTTASAASTSIAIAADTAAPQTQPTAALQSSIASGDVYLQTARVPIESADGPTVMATVLFDSASHRSYLTEK